MLVVIDSSGLAYRAMYAFGDSLTNEERQVGVVYGFLLILSNLFKALHTITSGKDRYVLVFAFDSRDSVRRKAYPDYRKARLSQKQSPERLYIVKEMKRQISLLRTTVLHEMGFRNQFMVPGFEADDVMAAVAESAKEPVILITSDRDLWQCLGSKVSMWSPSVSKMYTAEQFRVEHGIEPYMWSSVLAIAGCSTDGVKGVPGVGIKRAIAYLKGELNGTSAAARAIKEHWGVVERNVSLVSLPHPEMQGELFPVREDRLTEERVKEVFEKWNFGSLLSGARWEQWMAMCH